MKREIVLDTETTGLSPASGDRIVEIGCVELINHVPTGQHFHVYLNPQRDMPEEARRVHGLDDEFLADKPLFSAEADAFLEFIADDLLIIHNAPFDMGFLNAELERIKKPTLTNPVTDTVKLARQVHPGARVSLDALCKHYGIDNAKRTLHGALLDSEILAEVYLELIGGRQVALTLSSAAAAEESARNGIAHQAQQRPNPLPSRVTDKQRAAHAEFVASFGDDPLWDRYKSNT